ncbi:TPA: MFS transporter, partial [Candidatus Gracilibacteria bacterium]|nr:MFS transporter [Candidatus Gracilibacteria bacterium]
TQKKALHISNAVSSKIKEELKDLSVSGKESAKNIAKISGKFLNEARLLLLDILAKDNEVKRVVVPKHNFHVKEILTEISSSFGVLGKAFSLNTRYAFFWSSVMVMFFSFWDTMAITYQPLFLERFREDLGFWVAFIMPLFILPVFILQIPFGKLADKWGTHIMMMIGLFLSAISLMAMGSLDSIFNGSITVLIIAGVCNSIGYTAAFSASQVHFSGEVRYYLTKNKLEIKNSLLAAALRLSLNIGNILGQLFGGLIFSMLGFLTGFFLLGLFLFILFIVTLFFIKYLRIPEIVENIVKKIKKTRKKIHKTKVTKQKSKAKSVEK